MEGVIIASVLEQQGTGPGYQVPALLPVTPIRWVDIPTSQEKGGDVMGDVMVSMRKQYGTISHHYICTYTYCVCVASVLEDVWD